MIIEKPKRKFLVSYIWKKGGYDQMQHHIFRYQMLDLLEGMFMCISPEEFLATEISQIGRGMSSFWPHVFEVIHKTYKGSDLFARVGCLFTF